MSPIARIFSILNLVLAASFLAWASTTLAHSQDYKRQYEKEVAAHESTTTEMNDQISEITASRDQARTEAASHLVERDTATERADRLDGDLDQVRSDLSESQSNTQRLTNSVDAIQENNRQLQGDKDRAVESRHEAERSKESAEDAQQEAESDFVDAQGEIENLNNTLSDRDADIVALNRTISELETQLTTVVELTGVSFDQITAQPAIEAALEQRPETLNAVRLKAKMADILASAMIDRHVRIAALRKTAIGSELVRHYASAGGHVGSNIAL